MLFNTIFHPTSSFESAFLEHNNKKSLLVVLLAGLFLALAVFLLTFNTIYSIFAFATNILNWIIFSVILFFFEFVHARKKSKATVNGFGKSLSVVGTIWEINLLAYFVMAVGVWLLPNLSGFLFNLVAGAFFVLLILLGLIWVIASFKMLKVVFKANRGKLILNWIILMFLNSLIASIISKFLASLLL